MNWINAKKRLPKDDEKCLIYLGVGYPFEAKFDKNRAINIDNSYFIHKDCFIEPDGCCSYTEWCVDEHEPFWWISLADIPKPEMK